MTRNRFIRRANTGRITPEKSAMMNRARWDADNARRKAEMPEIMRELEEIEINNLPRKEGAALGCLQWHDFRSGKVRRWTIRIGDRMDRMTIDLPDNKRTNSHGWTWILTTLRKHLSK